MPGDVTIGELPALNTVNDATLLVAEDANTAYKVAGSVLKEYVGNAAMSAIADDVASVDADMQRAERIASDVALSSQAALAAAASAQAAAAAADASQQAIEDLGVDCEVLQPSDTPTVTKTVDQQGGITLIFGLVPGPAGPVGATGSTGATGPAGATGTAIGVEVTGLTDGLIWFAIDNNPSSPTYGHLIASYNTATGFNPAGLRIDFESDPNDPLSTYGHLLYDPDAA